MLNVFFHALASERTDRIASNLTQLGTNRALQSAYDDNLQRLRALTGPASSAMIDDYLGYAGLAQERSLVAHYCVGFFSGLLCGRCGCDVLPPDGGVANRMVEILQSATEESEREREAMRRLYAIAGATDLLDRMTELWLEMRIAAQQACLYAGRTDSRAYAGVIDLRWLSAVV